MADTAVDEPRHTTTPPAFAPESDQSLADTVRKLLRPLASLKLTVALFAMAIFIVLAGTLAQVNADIWEAIDGYFRTPIAWIEFQVFFPPAFFPSKPVVPGGFYFPGGWLIGLLMVINLLTAHGLRFKVQASGNRLVTGLLVIALGGVITWLVIVSGSNPDGLQHESWIGWPTLWMLLKLGLMALSLVSGYGWARLLGQTKTERWAVTSVGLGVLLLAGLSGWIWYQGDAIRMNDSGMRILWQLIKGTFAGLVLLGGCVMVFRKRAGIVLLHAGVLLMMFNELLVGTMAEEGRMVIREGETVNFVQDPRKVELAFADRSGPELDDVVVIPHSMLAAGKTIGHELLPCNVEVVRFLKNSVLRDADTDDENPADVGAGLNSVAIEARRGAGTDTGGKVDIASAYAKFTRKDGSTIGTYLLSQYLLDQPLEVDGKTYQVSLRFKYSYKPYSMTLLDVRKDDYLGTDTVRNYSSDVRLVDSEHHIDRQIRIWMNNPLRFAGATFYQSNYERDPRTGEESTTLQVVTNTGWMIPYVACMIVGTGMLAQFSIVLLRFLRRRAEEQAQPVVGVEPKKTRKPGKPNPSLAPLGTWPELAARFLPVVVVVIFAVWLAGKARVPDKPADGMNVSEFGKLPLVEKGRVKPFDTVARNALRIISDQQTFLAQMDRGALARNWADIRRRAVSQWSKLDQSLPANFDGDGHKLIDLIQHHTGLDRAQIERKVEPWIVERQPAIRWLLDVIARRDAAEQHRVFRIQSLEVLDALGLERRSGLRYSVSELAPKWEEFSEQVEQARKLDPKDWTLYQRKAMDLDRRVRTYTLLQRSFQRLPFPPIPTEADAAKDPEGVTKRLRQIKGLLEQAEWNDRQASAFHPPMAVPVQDVEREPGQKTWKIYSTAFRDAYLALVRREQVNPATLSLITIFQAYATGDAEQFNSAVADYRLELAANPPVVEPATGETVHLAKTNFEAFFNYFEPFYDSAVLYLVAFVLACLSWLGLGRPLNRASFWLITLTLAVHTFALVSRIYISGRPPVTNLYSSAVFIGWGAVVLGLALETIYRLGIGNVVASVAGFNTLLIAHILAADGDTFTVLVAVLDTQFWLATHVVCVTLGYATTFVAGLLGLLFVLSGVFSPALSPNLAKSLTRMIYGILCFALFFSFVGTVLGGLWADDSWGRFWGWDPKENGALIIVMWNALVMHARWDGMVKDRGLALLAIGGNITTSWSWFGVNELGVGLHSYGFTEGVLMTLGLFILSQLAVIGVGLLPRERWWSLRQQGLTGTEA